MVRAFEEGQPDKVWGVAQQIIGLAKEAVVEAARSRFRTNFGSERCSRCEGLKAGPGVAATCFQIQQCYYTNVRQDEVTPKQARVLKMLDP